MWLEKCSVSKEVLCPQISHFNYIVLTLNPGALNIMDNNEYSEESLKHDNLVIVVIRRN